MTWAVSIKVHLRCFQNFVINANIVRVNGHQLNIGTASIGLRFFVLGRLGGFIFGLPKSWHATSFETRYQGKFAHLLCLVDSDPVNKAQSPPQIVILSPDDFSESCLDLKKQHCSGSKVLRNVGNPKQNEGDHRNLHSSL